MERNGPDGVSLAEPKGAVAGLAEARRVREDGLEHGNRGPWLTADDAKDLRGRRLPLQRFAQLPGEQRDLLFVADPRSCRRRGRFALLRRFVFWRVVRPVVTQSP